MIPTALSTILLSIGGIIFVDLILSVDNALVIGTAVSVIPDRRRRWIVLVLGGVGAIILRVLFTASATFLLKISYLQAVGGILVLIIAMRLLLADPPGSETPQEEHKNDEGPGTNSELPPLVSKFSNQISKWIGSSASSENLNFILAVITVMIADITMSLDNIIAIGALAHGQVLLLIIGLLFSILLLLLGSALFSELINRLPWLLLFASGILAWVASDLIWNDAQRLSFIQGDIHYRTAIYAFSCVLVLVAIGIWIRRSYQAHQRKRNTAAIENAPVGSLPSKER